MIKSRTLAIAGSIAALSFVAVPIAGAAATHHVATTPARVDTSRDAKAVRHIDRTPHLTRIDLSRADKSADVRVS